MTRVFAGRQARRMTSTEVTRKVGSLTLNLQYATLGDAVYTANGFLGNEIVFKTTL